MRDPNAVVPPPLSREEQEKLHKGLGRKRLPKVNPMVAAHERDDISAKVQEDRHQEEDSHMQEEWQSLETTQGHTSKDSYSREEEKQEAEDSTMSTSATMADSTIDPAQGAPDRCGRSGVVDSFPNPYRKSGIIISIDLRRKTCNFKNSPLNPSTSSSISPILTALRLSTSSSDSLISTALRLTALNHP